MKTILLDCVIPMPFLLVNVAKIALFMAKPFSVPLFGFSVILFDAN